MDPERYLVVYCKPHNYGKLISITELSELDEFDIEGDLASIAECLDICKPSFFAKKYTCECELHGVIDIDEAGMLTLSKRYGYPHDTHYPKGWKLKYFLREIKEKTPYYKPLSEYFNRN